jgi:hypothetical protein
MIQRDSNIQRLIDGYRLILTTANHLMLYWETACFNSFDDHESVLSYPENDIVS